MSSPITGVTFLLLAFQAHISPEVPLALRMAEQYRRDIGALDATWRSVTFRDPDSIIAQGFCADGSGITDHRFRTRCAWNGDFATQYLGDPHGVLQYHDDGSPEVRGTSDGALIRKNGEVWTHLAGLSTACYWKDQNVEQWRCGQPPRDIRALGLVRRFDLMKLLGVDDVVGAGHYAWSFEQETLEDGIEKVSALNEYGTRTTWFINPAKGWNPEKITRTDVHGRESVEMVADVQLHDGGIWFPQSAAFYSSQGELVESIELESATFNDPQMKRLLPDSIGIEPGTHVFGQRGSLPPRPHIWNGDAITTAEEWWAAVENGTRQPGPSIIYAREHGTDHIVRDKTRAIGDLSLWEKYVAQFILRYKLDKDQQQKAWTIYRQCRSRAERYLSSRKQAIEELESRLRVAFTDAGLLSKRKALSAPIDEIFNRELKPRLDRLPTPAQRAQSAPAGHRQ